MRGRGLWVLGLCVWLADARPAMADEELARRIGCLRCHDVERKIKGPPFRAVAERYRGNPRARETLVEKVKHGGRGNWKELTGEARMPPHSALLSEQEIRTLVDWVLGR